MDETGELQLVHDIIPDRVTGFGTLKDLLEDISRTSPESQYPSRLIELSRLSLALLVNVGRSKYEEHSSKNRGIAYCGCRYIKGVVSEMTDLAQNGTAIPQMFSRLKDTIACFAIIAAVPEVIVRQTNDRSTREEFIRIFMDINIRGKKVSAPPEKAKAYSFFNDAVLRETEGVRQGILGEFLGFCLLRNQGFYPSLSSIKEDVEYGIDLYVNYKGQRFPVQVKTDSYLSPQEKNLTMKLAEIKNGKKLQLVINTKRLTSNQQTLESVIYPKKSGNTPFNINSRLSLAV